MVVRRRLKSKPSVSPVERLAVFGLPHLLEGEDAAKYDELLARICAAVEPVDIIEEMLVADVVCSLWDVLRWRRLKFSLLRARGYTELNLFLNKAIDYHLYMDDFERYLAEYLEKHFAQDEAQKLAHQYVLSEPNTLEKINGLTDVTTLLDRAQAFRAKELSLENTRHEREAVQQVNELLALKGVTLDSLFAEALNEELTSIERIDRLITVAEARRNASLYEIDRHRAALAQALRRAVQNVEDAEFRVIETTPAKGKRAA